VLFAYVNDSHCEIFKCVSEFKTVPLLFSWSTVQVSACAALMQLALDLHENAFHRLKEKILSY
jgi:hypothetical protein